MLGHILSPVNCSNWNAQGHSVVTDRPMRARAAQGWAGNAGRPLPCPVTCVGPKLSPSPHTHTADLAALPLVPAIGHRQSGGPVRQQGNDVGRAGGQFPACPLIPAASPARIAAVDEQGAPPVVLPPADPFFKPAGRGIAAVQGQYEAHELAPQPVQFVAALRLPALIRVQGHDARLRFRSGLVLHAVPVQVAHVAFDPPQRLMAGRQPPEPDQG